jgi:hypothetical protein
MRDDPPQRPTERFHGRVRDGQNRRCSHEGCSEAGDFRAPRSRSPERDGYNYHCLDHIRAFNAAWDFFKGLSREEIEAEQRGFGESPWVKDATPSGRASYGHPYGPGQGGPHLDDPLKVFAGQPRFGSRFTETATGPTGARISEKDRQSLRVLALDTAPIPELKTIRRSYKALVRRFHPDMNGGDRSHEVALRKVIDAYTHLSTSPAFAPLNGRS